VQVLDHDIGVGEDGIECYRLREAAYCCSEC
jgi:hypothetical protein